MASFLSNLGRNAVASSIASNLQPAVYVDLTLSIVIGVIVSLITLIIAFYIFEIHKNPGTFKDKEGKEVPAGPTSGIISGIVSAMATALVSGLIVQNIRWSIANPSYAAASAGLDALFGSIRR